MVQKSIPYVMLILLFSSCFKEVELDLDDVSPTLVIEGKVTDLPGPYFVYVGLSTGFYEENANVPITSANVRISDDQGFSETLIQPVPGRYETSDMQGIVGHTYTVEVDYEGQIYKASDFLGRIGKIDSLSVRYQEKSVLFDEGYYVSLNAQKSIQDQVNYYGGTVYKNDSALDGRELFFLASDQFTKSLSRVEFGYPFDLGDTITWELESLTKTNFDYYRQLVIIFDNDGLVSPVRYVNPPTNFSPEVLGIFQASAVNSDTVVIRE